MAIGKDTERGTWYFYGTYTDEDGKKHQYKRRGFKTKKECKKKENEYLEKHVIKKGLTLNEIIDEYLESRKESLKYDSYITYDSLLHALDDEICKKRIVDITPYMINDMITDNNLSTKKYKLMLIKSVFRFAFKNGYTDKNVAQDITIKKNPNLIEDKKTPNFWELEEFNKFISYVDDDFYKCLFMTLFYGGMRSGELRALEWSDLDNDILHITKTVQKNGLITPPKTKVSVRDVVMPHKVVAIINKLDKDNKYIFGKFSKPIPYATIVNRFDKYETKSGIKRISLHGLRHSHASYLLEHTDFDDVLIASRLGHSTEMLHRTYEHIYKKRQNKFDDYIRNL